MKLEQDSVEDYRAHVYQDAWHRGFAAGFACAAVVALATVFCMLAYGTFDKPVQTSQIKGKK